MKTSKRLTIIKAESADQINEIKDILLNDKEYSNTVAIVSLGRQFITAIKVENGVINFKTFVTKKGFGMWYDLGGSAMKVVEFKSAAEVKDYLKEWVME